MLQPKQTKFRKMHKGRNRGLAQNGNTIAFGRFGLVHQIEAELLLDKLRQQDGL